jgi:hypothetical protein
MYYKVTKTVRLNAASEAVERETILTNRVSPKNVRVGKTLTTGE